MACRPQPNSCDTFVFLSPDDSCIPGCFGKNSDRPSDEEHLIVHIPGGRQARSKVQCTYIEIPQVAETFGVVLSKPAWMWGCDL